jgi:plastocyanin
MRRIIALLAALLVVLVTACGDDDGGGGSSGGGSDTPVELSGEVTNEGEADVAADGDAVDLEVELDDFYFKPTFIKAKEGQTITVELRNEGQTNHTFTNDDLGIDEEVAPDDTATVEVTVPADTFAFYCRFHQGRGMQGAIYTEAGAAVTGSGGSGGGGGGTPGY